MNNPMVATCDDCPEVLQQMQLAWRTVPDLLQQAQLKLRISFGHCILGRPAWVMLTEDTLGWALFIS